MTYSAKVLLDSAGLDQGTSYKDSSRLTTLELTFPRIILSEFNTHRMLSRNAASSRAIPTTKLLDQVQNNPFIPKHWGANQKGMQAFSILPSDKQQLCKTKWLKARDEAVKTVEELLTIGLHKQIANRLLEPWMWVTVIASATNWSNFFFLRCHEDAEPHIRHIALMAKDEITKSDPKIFQPGDWHLPLTNFEGDEHLSIEDKLKIGTGRCARVSYLTHDGRRDLNADIDLHDRLVKSGHWSPFEHCALYLPSDKIHDSGLGGNFGKCWRQYRKLFNGECK